MAMYRIIIATRNEALADRLGHASERQASMVRVEPDTNVLLDTIGQMAPDLVLLDADARTGFGANFPACARAVSELRGGLKFGALGDENHPGTVLMAVRAGAAEFIGTDSNDDEIAEQLGRLLRLVERRERTEAGRLSVIFAGRPNEGESLFAINLAVLLAKRAPEAGDVVLVDCTLPVSECDVALDLETSYGLRDALHDMARMDRTLLTSTLARHKSSGLYVLPLAVAVESVRDLQANSLLALISVLRGLFSDVVLNIGSFRHASLLRQFCEQATVSFVYVTQSFSSLRACHGVLEQAEISKRERAEMVLVIADHDPDITLGDRQITEALEITRTLRLPMARAELTNSLNNGQPMPEVAPRSAYVAALQRAADMRAVPPAGGAKSGGAKSGGAKSGAKSGAGKPARGLLARLVPSLS
jgi:pilus assembly protein CpaE